MNLRLSILFLLFSALHATAQFGTSNTSTGSMKSGFDSSGVSRDTSRVEIAGLDLSETGVRKLQRITYSLDRFQFYLPVYQSQYINSTIGNNGTAIQNLNFRPTFNSGFNWGFNSFSAYTLDLKDLQFYDAQSPYTEAAYTQGGKQEAFFKIRHIQNVGKSFNFGLEFQRVNSEGTYLRQTAAHSALRFNFWYRPGKERYQILAGINYHKGASFENGGITAEGDSTFQTNTQSNRQLYAVNLVKARNKIFKNGFLVRQTYDLVQVKKDSSGTVLNPAILRLQNTFQYSLYRHSYDDENPNNSYYSTILDTNRTFVDYYNPQWENEIALLKLSALEDSAQQMHWEAKAFLKQQGAHVWMEIPVNGINSRIKIFNQSVGGKINYHFRPAFSVQGSTELFFAGYNQGDISLSGSIHLKPSNNWGFIAGVESFSQEPVYQLRKFDSNFGSWDNNSFKKINLLRVFGTISLDRIHTDLSVSNQLISNWVFMGLNANPEQANSVLNVLRAEVSNKIRVQKWYLYSRILIQQTNGNSVLSLPLVQYQESIFREGKIRKTTPWRIGIDLIGCTSFQANAYQPQSGLFYLQNQKKNSGLFQANFYISAKIRRARIFAMLEHANFGIANNQSYVIPYYPLPDRLIKVGFNWVFFD